MTVSNLLSSLFADKAGAYPNKAQCLSPCQGFILSSLPARVKVTDSNQHSTLFPDKAGAYPNGAQYLSQCQGLMLFPLPANVRLGFK